MTTTSSEVTRVGADAEKLLRRLIGEHIELRTILGLATVYGIVRQSGGHIEVFNALGKGTHFLVYLPRAESPPEVEPDPPHADRPGGTEIILLVEDEDGVRDLVCRILRQHGYTVLETSHPRDALRTCARHQGPIHLLLTDVVLPELSGRDVARRLAPSVPGMKVLYMSGHTGSVVLQQGVLAAEGPFLPKPFTPEVLLCKVRAVLDR